MTHEAFAGRIVAIQERLYRVSASLLRQEADREDAVQSCIEEAWRKRALLRDEGRFDAWITRILINEYLEMLEEKIMLFATSSHLGSYPRYSILRKQGYRVLIVQRHLIFYKADDDKHEIMIYAIVDARQQYLNLV